MARGKQLTWTELRVGLFVLVALFVLAVGIIYVTGAGVLGPKYRLFTYLPEVSGLSNGAPVKLDGVEVGNVESIKLVQPKPGEKVDKDHNIEVIMRIDKKYQEDIKTDSTASLVTEGLLGNRYVNLTRGFTGTVLKENGTVSGGEEKAIKEVVERSADLLANLTALTDSAKGLLGGIQEGKGTLGKLLTDEQAYNNLNGILANSNAMVRDIREGKGTLGKIVSSDEMYTKVDKALDNVNGIVTDVKEQKGTIGKLLYDPTLYDQAKQAISNTNGLLADVRAGKGSLGKLATDETLYNKLRDTSSNLANATAKLNDNTTTAGKMFSDPQLYDNLTGLTGDLRLLIGDFRQNPKKFLRIKVAVF